MKMGKTVILDITDTNNLGCGIGRIDGKVVFVKGAVTGDRVSATVIKENKKFSVARLVEIISPSQIRTQEAFCPAPLSCGGCVYRHVDYAHEKVIKQNTVKAAFVKAGLDGVHVRDLVCTGKTHGYRNKAQYPVCKTKKGIRYGFYASATHNVIASDSCSIQNGAFAPIAARVCELCDEYGVSVHNSASYSTGLRHIYLRIGEATGEILLCLVSSSEAIAHESELSATLMREFPSLVGILYNVNTADTSVILGDRWRILCGRDYIEDELCGLRFNIGARSFYQVNREGAQLLYSLAKREAALTGEETVADLYCGTGTIGLVMADRAKSVVGVEIVEEAVALARQNAALNGIKNAKFFCADASFAQTLLDCCGGKAPDVIVIDPPRKGTTRELIECIASLDVRRVVYVSCDPTTLARDCVHFKELGYDIGEVTPVDMFPRTGHVESVVCLTRKI